MADKESKTSPFTLKADSAFGNRSNDIFGGLQNIEAKHDAYETAKTKCKFGNNNNKTIIAQSLRIGLFPGKRDESPLMKEDPKEDELMLTGGPGYRSRGGRAEGFKRPRGLPPKSRQPRDSNKWTHYNLADVSDEDLSERSNTAAALSFLQSRQNPNKRQKTEDSPVPDSEPTKHVFTKLQTPTETTNSAFRPPSRNPGCRMMPEYVVGASSKPKKNKGKGSRSTTSQAKVSIGHLMDEEEEEDADDCPVQTVREDCTLDSDEEMSEVKRTFLSKKSRKSVRMERREEDDDQSTDDDKDMDLDGVD